MTLSFTRWTTLSIWSIVCLYTYIIIIFKGPEYKLNVRVTEGEITSWQSRETGQIGYTRHKTKITKKNQKKQNKLKKTTTKNKKKKKPKKTDKQNKTIYLYTRHKVRMEHINYNSQFVIINTEWGKVLNTGSVHVGQNLNLTTCQK